MEELFRLKIVGKRQITLPQRMMNALGLDEGDELQVEVGNGQIKTVRPMKLIPTDLFTPEILLKLDQRERESETYPPAPVEESRFTEGSERPAAVSASSVAAKERQGNDATLCG